MKNAFFSLIFASTLLSQLNGAIHAKSPETLKVETVLTQKCMDCHSMQTEYPWYSKLPVAKDLIQADIDKGRSYFNIQKDFVEKESEAEIGDHLIRRLGQIAEHNEMPPLQYAVAHWDKVLTAAEKKLIIDWSFKNSSKVFEPLPTKEEVIKELGLNKDKITLGEKLYHETRLSGDNTISCASCHDLAKGGTDQAQFATGIDGHLGPINSPTVYNSNYNIKQFWDGRANDLEAQAHGPVHSPGEMGSNWQEVISKLQNDSEYKKLFKKAYGTKEMTGDRIANSIAEFEKSLVTPNSRFDLYLKGDETAITKEELEGYKLFTKKYNCSSCHSGVAIGGRSFQKMGIAKDYFADRAAGKNGLNKMALTEADQGRFNHTQNQLDMYKFKVPILRNIELTYPYMHDGNVQTLEEAVKIMAEYQSGKEISKKEISQITAFLKSLTGKNLSPQ